MATYSSKAIKNIVWSAFPGSQRQFLSCPIWECLLSGNRGGGKSDVLLMDFLQGVGVGYKSDWRGILFREAYTELTDIIAKTKKWIPQIFPGAKYNSSAHKWVFADGEELLLRYIRTEDDYWQYHGHEYPWIGWEELTNWVTPVVYLKMMSCNRSSNSAIPRKYRATCNPSGPGHQWVKDRFINTCLAGKIFVDDHGQSRTHIRSSLEENLALLNSDPLYKEKLMSMTEDNPMLRKAWVEGSWDLISGGFFTDVWDRNIHILQPFKLNPHWQVYRSFDWGSSKPWGVTYFAECNGEETSEGVWFPKDTNIIINEVYGWTGVPNEGDRATSSQIAEKTLLLDKAIFDYHKIKVIPGPADTSIWEVRDGTSIAKNLKSFGLKWTKAYKGPGSRISGLSLIREQLGAAKRGDIEKPGLYFFTSAPNHIRTFPLMQHDRVNREDINSDLEDHLVDSTRYGLARKLSRIKRGKMGH